MKIPKVYMNSQQSYKLGLGLGFLTGLSLGAGLGIRWTLSRLEPKINDMQTVGKLMAEMLQWTADHALDIDREEFRDELEQKAEYLMIAIKGMGYTLIEEEEDGDN